MYDNNETLIIKDATLTEDSEGGVPVKQQLFLVGGILLLIFGSTITTYIFNFVKNNDTSQPAAVPYVEEQVKDDTEGDSSKPFSAVETVAKAVYVWDINNQRVLYKKNESESLPLASVTKLMTALVAHEILNENDNVAIDGTAIDQEGDSGLLENESFKRQTLSDLVLMSSSNDGAFALASAAGKKLGQNGSADFIKAMNLRAEEIGLHETEFYNPTGLDLNETQAGAYGSARDMAFLMEYLVKNNPSLLESTTKSEETVFSQDGFSHEADNTNFYLDEIPGLIGSKTGYTDLAGGNLVIAYDAGLNRPVVISVLGSTHSNRFTDVLNLIDATNKYLSQ